MRALQISLTIFFFFFTQNSTLELLFESRLPQPYEFPRLYFPMICPRLFHDPNFDFKSALNLYYIAKVSAFLFTIRNSNPWALQVRCTESGLKFRIYGLRFNVKGLAKP